MIAHLSSRKCKKTFNFKELKQVTLKFSKRIMTCNDYQKYYQKNYQKIKYLANLFFVRMKRQEKLN
jgi:hypothetical protein